MDTEWWVEAGEQHPVLVVPWLDKTSASVYVDLRTDAAGIEQVPEAAAWPELRSALLLINARGTGLWTAKCDAWELGDDEKELDFGPVACGIGCYIDIGCATPAEFASLDKQLSLIQLWSALAAHLEPKEGRALFILRPAEYHQTPGFATSVYVYGYGMDMREARVQWGLGLKSVIRTILAEKVE